VHTVTLGRVEVTALCDAPIHADPHLLMFEPSGRPVPAEQLVAEYGHLLDADGSFPGSFTYYLISSEHQLVLVDTGIGPWPRAGRESRLDQGLVQMQVAPEDIDLVVRTHLHFVHVVWNTVDAGDGTPRVFFPRAAPACTTASTRRWPNSPKIRSICTRFVRYYRGCLPGEKPRMM